MHSIVFLLLLHEPIFFVMNRFYLLKACFSPILTSWRVDKELAMLDKEASSDVRKFCVSLIIWSIVSPVFPVRVVMTLYSSALKKKEEK